MTAPYPINDDQAKARLDEALRLARLMLFELDVMVWALIAEASSFLLCGVWKGRQPSAVVALSRLAVVKQLMKQQTDFARE